MCLITTDKERKIAKDDITVFKLFRTDNRSPYYEFDYTPYINKQFDDTSEEQIRDSSNNVIYGDCLVVEGGFIHSFGNLVTAQLILSGEDDNLCRHIVIRRCIIPKGTEYYYSNIFGEFASKSIIVGEIAFKPIVIEE